jgi:hypothetical protein
VFLALIMLWKDCLDDLIVSVCSAGVESYIFHVGYFGLMEEGLRETG